MPVERRTLNGSLFRRPRGSAPNTENHISQRQQTTEQVQAVPRREHVEERAARIRRDVNTTIAKLLPSDKLSHQEDRTEYRGHIQPALQADFPTIPHGPFRFFDRNTAQQQNRRAQPPRW